mgnify:CR=1 FL=1
MKYTNGLRGLVPGIFALALLAAGAGFLWPGEGAPYPWTTVRGETVMINGHGLYFYDTVSSVAQMQGNDIVTLFVGLPLLAISFWMAQKGSLRGHLLLTGTLGFFLYTYMSMCFGTAYNPLFLVYVALFGLSLYAFILSMLAFDLAQLPQRFSEHLPRRTIASFFVVLGAFLSLAWLGRIAPTLLQGTTPALENVTSMFIQAMDLALIVPLAILAALLLWRRSAWGYLLASVAIMKFVTMGLAVSVMGLNMWRAGVPTSPVELGIFPTITVVNLVLAVLLLSNIDSASAQSAPFIRKPLHTSHSP